MLAENMFVVSFSVVFAAVIACGAALSGAAIPTHASVWSDILDYAIYDPETGDLTLYFTGPINPHIKVYKILVGGCDDSWCTTVPLSGQDSVLISDDRESAIIALSAHSQKALERPIPTVQAHGGIRSAVDGSLNLPGKVPVMMPGERPASLLERAEYIVKTNELILYFDDAIDSSSLQPTYIHIFGAYTHYSHEFLRVSNDGKQVVLKVSADDRDELVANYNLSVRFNIGTYRSESSGIVNGEESVQIVVVGDRPPLPTHVKLLSSAVYHTDTRNLNLRFDKPFNPDSMDLSLVRIVGSNNNTDIDVPISEWYDVTDVTGQAIRAVKISEHTTLLSMTNPTLRIEAGAYRGIDGGVPNNTEEVSLEVVDRVTLLERAEYIIDSNKLVLYFTEEVDPISFVHEYDGGIIAASTLGPTLTVGPPIEILERYDIATHLQPLHVYGGDDGKSIIIVPDPKGRNILLAFPDQTVRINEGIYRSSATGLVNGLEQTPVTMIRQEPVITEIPASVLLERSEYSVIHDELTLYFGEEINPFSINPARITILDDGCDGVTLSAQEFVRVSGDRQSVLFSTDPLKRLPLSIMTNPRIHVEQGAFATHADGTANKAGDVPLSVNNRSAHTTFVNSLQEDDAVQKVPCTLTYYIEPPSPRFNTFGYDFVLTARHIEIILSAVRDGLNAWSEANPHLTLVESATGTANVKVNWVELPIADGLACVGCLREAPTLFVDLKSIATPSNLLHNPDYVYNRIKHVTAHEFGHNLGLLHHSDSSHLMYSNDIYVQDSFDDLGYNIPVLD